MTNNQWNNIIIKIFNDKKNLQNEFLNFTKIKKYNKYTKFIEIKIEKDYLSRIIISRIDEFKLYLEKELNDTVFYIKINNRKFEFFSSLQKDKISDVKKEDIKNIPISYKTSERIINGNFFLNEKIKKENLNRVVDLFFYNKLFYSTKKITVNYKILHNKKNVKYSIYFCWTIFIPLVFSFKILNNKIKYSKIKKEINDLINLKYIPLNQETEKFVKLYL
ncbi:MAG: hypothetical protein HPAVJP_3420 [Candidatus Hepatoplasma vulgare]|nr:MAG: hypothetical protein HPAVJP_3420 [Candidatus Hepatoplasma sp.]